MKTKKKVIIALVAVLVAVGIGISGFLIMKNVFWSSDSQTGEDKLVTLSNENYKLFEEGFTDIKVTDEESTLEAVATVAEAIGITDAEKELKVESTSSFDGETYYRMQQYYNDLPVYGRAAILVSNEEGTATALNSNTIDIENLSVETELDSTKAEETIKSFYTGDVESEYVETCIFSLGTDDPQPAYEYTVYLYGSGDDSSNSNENNEIYGGTEETAFVSADDYSIIANYSNTYYDREYTPSDYAYKTSDNNYILFDEKRNISVIDSNKKLTGYTFAIIEEVGRVPIICSVKGSVDESLAGEKTVENYISNYTTITLVTPISYVSSTSQDASAWNKKALKVMNNVEASYDFYNDFFGIKGFDGKNSALFVSYRDKVSNEDNGKNSESSGEKGNFLRLGYDYDNSIDIVGHEYTHSVEKNISNMVYEGESGALDEALSDIFGELIQDYYDDSELNNTCNWKSSVRSASNPNDKIGIFGEHRPSVYKGENWVSTEDTGEDNDYGGVHTNCTVISHAAYLMTQGIDSDEDTKISNELLAKLLYKTMYTLQMDSTMEQFANNFYSTALRCDDVTLKQLSCIQKSFSEVGIDCGGSSDNYLRIQSGTKLYVLDENGEKYDNYHLVIKREGTEDVAASADVTDSDGYTLELEPGNYTITVSDNSADGSKTTFSKTINIIKAIRPDKIGYLNIQTDFAGKTAEDYVYTAKDAEIPYSKTHGKLLITGDGAGGSTMQCRLPQLSLTSDDAKEINEDIHNKFDSIFKEYETESDFYWYAVDYRCYLNSSVLSLIIENRTQQSFFSTFYVYNIDVLTGERLYNDDLIQMSTVPSNEASPYNQLYKVIESKFDDDSLSGWASDEAIESTKNKSLATDNLESSGFYFNDGGTLCVAYRYYWFVDGGIQGDICELNAEINKNVKASATQSAATQPTTIQPTTAQPTTAQLTAEQINEKLNAKLNELTSEYGTASVETLTNDSSVDSSENWTHRKGVVSAKLADLDGDGINELVVARLIGGELNSTSENLEIQVYNCTSEGVNLAGSANVFTGNDFKEKEIDAFICKIGDTSYIFVESDFTMYGTDASSGNTYDVFEYSNGKFSKKLRVYLEKSDYGITEWTEVTYDGNKETERELYYYCFDFSSNEVTAQQGEYKDSDDPVKDYFMDFGLNSPGDTFSLSRRTRFFNSDGTDKMFEYTLSREKTDLTQYTSTLTDYTGLAR